MYIQKQMHPVSILVKWWGGLLLRKQRLSPSQNTATTASIKISAGDIKWAENAFRQGKEEITWCLRNEKW